MKRTEALPDIHWMRAALEQAQAAGCQGEVPVGAVVVLDNQIIGVGRNAPIRMHDPSAHAEILALRQAAVQTGNYRLEGCELFVTLEPCAMCAGAMLHARLKRVVFGSADPKTGAAGSVIDLFAQRSLNHQTRVQAGVLAQECGALLQDFFMQRRSTSGSTKWPLRDDALRTPERCFEGLPEMPGNSCYVNDLTSLMGLRMHYLTLGFRDAPIVYLCVHGIAGWSFEWRGFMSTRTSHECVIAVDLIGFGKSDKPKKASFHSVSWHVQVLLELLERLNLKDVILVQPMPQTTNQSITEDALGHALMSRASHCIAKRQCVVLSALSDPVLEAPFPDAGHRAAQRTFKT